MNPTSHRSLLLAGLLAISGLTQPGPARAAVGAENAIFNQRYRVQLGPGGAARIEADGVFRDFLPEFTVLHRTTDPQFAVRPDRVKGVSYSVETWLVGDAGKKPEAPPPERPTIIADGWDPQILHGDQEGRTADFHAAGNRRRITARSARIRGGVVEWNFEADGQFQLSAGLSLPEGSGEPVLRVTFTPAAAGWYSVGYTGAPAVDPSSADEFFQPPLWTRRRFPAQSYLTTHRATLPGVMFGAGEVVVGVLADPSLLPFQPLPELSNIRFGVALRNAESRAQPMVFSPVLGGAGSQCPAGGTVDFKLRLFLMKGSIDAAHEYLARNLMGVSDYRHNDLCSTNTTLENIVEYALSPFALFDEALRGSSYETDLPGAVNNVSGLHPLSLAVILDREDIYRRRALPMIEAGLSRTKRLFAPDPKVGKFSDWTLQGPNMFGAELAALVSFSQGRAAALLELARKSPRGNRLAGHLELYRATGEHAHLARAGELAREEIDGMKAGRSDLRVGYWNARTPWILLTELHEETGDPRYLPPAVEGAREYAQFVWMGPRIPEGEARIAVNPGGHAPLYWYMKAKGKEPMPAPEATMPAWRASEIGLTTEVPRTSTGHRGVFLAVPMTWMLRLGQQADVPFFRDLARGALVGRSMSFPGYHLNTARTDVYEKADYPRRPSRELSYNSFHYNHIWPHAAMLLDYLVTDIEGLSGGRIRFPGHFVEAYSYLQSRVYGARAGRFYDQDEAWLWMPAGLVASDSTEINWLAARSPGGLCLAFANQARQAATVTVRLDPRRLPGLRGAVVARRWDSPGSPATATIQDGVFSFTIEPRGLVAIRLPGVTPSTQFQQKILGGGARPEGGSVAFDFGGSGLGYRLVMGSGLASGYAFLRAKPGQYASVALEARIGEGWQVFRDGAYPFEFTVPLPDHTPFVFRFVARHPDGREERSPTYEAP